MIAGGRAVAGRHQRAKRGKIAGWSSASRRRMRRYMLQHRVPDGWCTWGVTLTIPGPPLPGHMEKAIWDAWRKTADKKGWAAIWRLELQKRGARHWHLLMGTPASNPVGLVRFKVMQAWWQALDSIGAQRYESPVNGWLVEVKGLSSVPGARMHSAVVECAQESHGAWLRYLQDHASKRKQEQSAEGAGRQWGVIGRRWFVARAPSEVCQLDDAAFWRFLRAYQRLCTPSRPAPCVFGRRLGYRPQRGNWGASVWFSRPDTVRRLVDWANGGASITLS